MVADHRHLRRAFAARHDRDRRLAVLVALAMRLHARGNGLDLDPQELRALALECEELAGEWDPEPIADRLRELGDCARRHGAGPQLPFG